MAILEWDININKKKHFINSIILRSGINTEGLPTQILSSCIFRKQTEGCLICGVATNNQLYIAFKISGDY
jgi:hypothetical protein